MHRPLALALLLAPAVAGAATVEPELAVGVSATPVTDSSGPLAATFSVPLGNSAEAEADYGTLRLRASTSGFNSQDIYAGFRDAVVFRPSGPVGTRALRFTLSGVASGTLTESGSGSFVASRVGVQQLAGDVDVFDAAFEAVTGAGEVFLTSTGPFSEPFRLDLVTTTPECPDDGDDDTTCSVTPGYVFSAGVVFAASLGGDVESAELEAFNSLTDVTLQAFDAATGDPVPGVFTAESGADYGGGPAVIPLPAAGWLLASAVAAAAGLRARRGR